MKGISRKTLLTVGAVLLLVAILYALQNKQLDGFQTDVDKTREFGDKLSNFFMWFVGIAFVFFILLYIVYRYTNNFGMGIPYGSW